MIKYITFESTQPNLLQDTAAYLNDSVKMFSNRITMMRLTGLDDKVARWMTEHRSAGKEWSSG